MHPCNDALTFARQISDMLGQVVLYIDEVIAIAPSSEELAKALSTWAVKTIDRTSRRAELIKEGMNDANSASENKDSPRSRTLPR